MPEVSGIGTGVGESPPPYDIGTTCAWGSGKSVVLALHGFSGCGLDFRMCGSGTPELDSGVRWIAPDLPGHGVHRLQANGFRLPLCPSKFDWFSTLEWLEKIVRPLALAGTKVHLLGYSLGGRMALALLARSPQLFASAVIVSASPGISQSQARSKRRQQDEEWARQAETLTLGEFIDLWKSQPLLASQLHLLEVCHKEDWEARDQRLALHSGTGLAAALRAFSPGNVPPPPPRFHFFGPVLLLAGERDHVYRKHAEDLAARFPFAKSQVIPHSGHAPHLENTFDTGQALTDFWKLTDPFLLV